MAVRPEPLTLPKIEYFDLQTTFEICKGSDQVMVYGWQHCGYRDVFDAIYFASQDEMRGSPIKQVYCARLGNPTNKEKTLEGRDLCVLSYAPTKNRRQETGRRCKTALTNLVIENAKRLKAGLPVIPLLFCIDIVENQRPLRKENICSKEKFFNDQITHKELRRAYKLSTHENPLIRRAAEETFRFVKVAKNEEIFFLERARAPWTSPKFRELWDARKKLSQSKPKPDKYDWRKQVEKEIPSPQPFTPARFGRAIFDVTLTAGRIAAAETSFLLGKVLS